MGEGIVTLIILFIVVLSILWIMLPFLIMGTNNRLDKLIRLMQIQNAGSDVRSGAAPGTRTPPTEPKPGSKPKVEGGENSTLKALVVLAVLGAVAVLIYYGGMM